jgi:hypothetical protein
MTPVIRYLPIFSGAFITIVTLPSPLSSGPAGCGGKAASAIPAPVVESENFRRLSSIGGWPVLPGLVSPP